VLLGTLGTTGILGMAGVYGWWATKEGQNFLSSEEGGAFLSKMAEEEVSQQINGSQLVNGERLDYNVLILLLSSNLFPSRVDSPQIRSQTLRFFLFLEI